MLVFLYHFFALVIFHYTLLRHELLEAYTAFSFAALISILVNYILLYWPLIKAEWPVTAMLHTRVADTKSFPSIMFLIIAVLVFVWSLIFKPKHMTLYFMLLNFV